MIRKPAGVEFWFGDIVFLRVRDERYRGMITTIILQPSGVLYSVTWEEGEVSNHYGMELTRIFVPDFGVDEENESDESTETA